MGVDGERKRRGMKNHFVFCYQLLHCNLVERLNEITMSTETLTLSNKRIKLSLEPIKLSESLINSLDQNQQQPLEEVEDSIFNSPLKLFDCNLETGLESFTR